MTEINRYALMMEALAELKPELDAERARQVKPTPALPSLNEVLADYGPMPPEALFLGVASDGLPVLLNLHDPVPGPILISADPGAGKTALLQTIALATGKMHQPDNVQFGVLTNHPDEWSGMENIPNNVGVFPLYNQSAEDFILSLASWRMGIKPVTNPFCFCWMIWRQPPILISMQGKTCAGFYYVDLHAACGRSLR